MRPPRLADWLIWRLAPGRIREPTIGDLHEEFEQFTVRELGAGRAKLWYWKQVLAILVWYRLPRRATAFPQAHGFGISRRSLVGQVVFSGVVILTLAVWYPGVLPDGASEPTPSVLTRRPATYPSRPTAEPGILERQIAAYRLEYRNYVEQATNDVIPAYWNAHPGSAGGDTESPQEVSAVWIGWEWEHDPPSALPAEDTGLSDQAWVRPATP